MAEFSQTSVMENNNARVIYLLTYPRTASNLLFRILSLDRQPNAISPWEGGYFFRPVVVNNALPYPGKHVQSWTMAERTRAAEIYQSCFANLWEWVEKARAENKILFVKEHLRFMVNPTAMSAFMHGEDTVCELPWTVQTPAEGFPSSGITVKTHSRMNKTILPDEVLADGRHIFLIRHPALTIPSCYRAFVDIHGQEALQKEEANLLANVTLHWTRYTYEWLKSTYPSSDGVWPMIVDGDDIMTEPQLLTVLCEHMGMDSSKLQFEWTPATEAELNDLPDTTMKTMRGTLLTSPGVMKEKAWDESRSIETEAGKWSDEFGDSGAKWIEKWVRMSMSDYEFLKARRVNT